MKNTLFALLLLSATFAMGQGSVLSGGPVVANPLGQPLPGVTVAVCNSDPGTPTTGGCPGHLATLYTDVTVGTACTGTTPIQPLSNPGGLGSGCSNPGTVDGRGNAVAFAHTGQYWCEYYGTGLTGVAVQPCMFPGTSSGVAPVTITCSGTDKLSAYNSATGAFSCSAVAGGSPAGPDTAVQFKDGTVFGGSSSFLFDKDGSHSGNGTVTVTATNQGATKSSGLYVSTLDNGGAATSTFASVTASATNLAGAPAGTLDSMYGLYARVLNSSAAATLTDQAGVFIASGANDGTLTNNIGLQIDTQTVGTSNYGIEIGDIGAGGAGDFAIKTGAGEVSVFDKFVQGAAPDLTFTNYPASGEGGFFVGFNDGQTHGVSARLYGGTMGSAEFLLEDSTGNTSYHAANGFVQTTLDAGQSFFHVGNDTNTSANVNALFVQPYSKGTGAQVNGLIITLDPRNTDTTSSRQMLTLNAGASGTAVNNKALVIESGRFLLAPETPASSIAPCTVGTIAEDASFVYVCTATDTWKRAALSAF